MDGLLGFCALAIVLCGIFVAARNVLGRRLPRQPSKFANPANFLSDFELAAELERRRSADPEAFAASVARQERLAPTLDAAVKAEKAKAMARIGANRAIVFPTAVATSRGIPRRMSGTLYGGPLPFFPSDY
jgi:hypothetical protein